MITAADVMTKPARTVLPTTTLADVARLLWQHKISAAPVCRADGTLAGIISEADLIRARPGATQARRDWWLGLLAEGEDLPKVFLDYIGKESLTADAVMAIDVVTAGEHDTLPRLAAIMTDHKVKRVPILRDGHLVGIVSRSDLVAAIARDALALA